MNHMAVPSSLAVLALCFFCGACTTDAQGEPGKSAAFAAPQSGGGASGKRAIVTGENRRAKLAIGQPAPDFSLVDLAGETVRLSNFKGKTVVLEWFSPTCPYSVFAWGDKGPLRELAERLKSQGVVWLTINSEEPSNAGGQPERNRKFARENMIGTPLLMDPTGVVGRSYEAKTTPHMYVINAKGVLVYRGALDNAPLGAVKDNETKMNYVQAAISDVKVGHAVTASETKPYG